MGWAIAFFSAVAILTLFIGWLVIDLFDLRVQCNSCGQKRWFYQIKIKKYIGGTMGYNIYNYTCKQCHRDNYDPTLEFLQKNHPWRY